MANIFLNKTDLMDRDVETALLLEKVITTNIGNAVAYTDGDKVFMNTEENLTMLLPAYNQKMLKWLLWHEKMHLELRHHNRFFKYLSELSEKDTEKEFQVSKSEVNIIMDILVHDSLAKMFPELVDTALVNLAQMRNRNSLTYTFKTHTLEEMLNEYKAHKKGEDKPEKEEDKTEEEGEDKPEEDKTEEEGEDKPKKDPKKKGHSESTGETPKDKDDKTKDEEPEIKDTPPSERPDTPPDEHDKTDWSKLEELEDKEFITEEESETIQEAVNKLKKTKFKLAKLTETLNGLVTSTRKRSYAMPSTIHTNGGVLIKGSTPGRTQLYLIFDASGSMMSEMDMFKEIISKSIPQAMNVTCEWFAGYDKSSHIKPYKKDGYDGYYKAKFKDFMNISAYNGYSDDGDRTIELCWQAEQLGYSPIGVTDGGGRISWSKDKLRQLKKTVFVGQNNEWLRKIKEINPKIQILDV